MQYKIEKIHACGKTRLHITTTLKGGAVLKISASTSRGRWYLDFKINGSWELEELSRGERMQATKFLRLVWGSFNKYPCECIPSSLYHEKVYTKLGFVADEWDQFFYDPS